MQLDLMAADTTGTTDKLVCFLGFLPTFITICTNPSSSNSQPLPSASVSVKNKPIRAIKHRLHVMLQQLHSPIHGGFLWKQIVSSFPVVLPVEKDGAEQNTDQDSGPNEYLRPAGKPAAPDPLALMRVSTLPESRAVSLLVDRRVEHL